ncbi:MAG: YggT family protein [Firmicutes bacterium HGW-Firmicutes-8]|nr:MAG: YggT family protein [Firmicutes bacterium HGW-Firmicutes-8]
MIRLIVDGIFTAIWWLVIARLILSFLPLFMRIDPYNPVVRFINETTEPLMAPFRRLVPPVGGIDFSPMIMLFVLQLFQNWIMKLI